MVIEQIKDQLTAWCRSIGFDLTAGPSVERELALVKVRGTGEKRMEACGSPMFSAPA